MDSTQKTSSLVTDQTVPIRNDQFQFQTWHLVVLLIIAAVVIKKFVYIKDKTRNDQ